jgi:hypothetical protein
MTNDQHLGGKDDPDSYYVACPMAQVSNKTVSQSMA